VTFHFPNTFKTTMNCGLHDADRVPVEDNNHKLVLVKFSFKKNGSTRRNDPALISIFGRRSISLQ